MDKIKIPYKEWANFNKLYWSGFYKGLRYGQLLVNIFDIPPSEETTRLFYAKDHDVNSLISSLIEITNDDEEK